jgi:hypothetical protein
MGDSYGGNFIRGEQESVLLGQSCPSAQVTTITNIDGNRKRRQKKHSTEDKILRESLYKQAKQQAEVDRVSHKENEKQMLDPAGDGPVTIEDCNPTPGTNGNNPKPQTEPQIIEDVVSLKVPTRKRREPKKEEPAIDDASDSGTVTAHIDDQSEEKSEDGNAVIFGPVRKRRHGSQ